MSLIRSHGTRRSVAYAALGLVAALLALAALLPAHAMAAGTGHVTGRVTDGTAPLAGYYVAVFGAQSSSSWNEVGSATTRSDGTYDVGGLASGKYQVEFGFAVDPGYVTRVQFWDRMHDFREATPVNVTSGRTTSGINGTFLPGTGSIAGTVTSPAGPVAGIHVDVSGSDGAGCWDGGGSAVTSADGSFSVTGLVEDAYQVHFTDPTGSFPGQYFKTATGKDYIGLVPGTNAVASIVLKGIGHITGRVSNGGVALTYVTVSAYQSNGEGGWSWVKDAMTADDGAYDLTLPAPGTYRIVFTDQSRTCAEQVYPNAADLDHGGDVAVPLGSKVNGIDGVLGPGGRITGSVAGGSGPLDSVRVSVYRDAGLGDWARVDDANTKSDGTYEVKGLGTGAYHVVFMDPSLLYLAQVFQGVDTTVSWLPDMRWIAAGTDVTVTAGSAVQGVDASLSAVDYAVHAPLESAVTVVSDHASTKFLRAFVLSGVFSPGRRGDLVRVEVQKPWSARWSYSSARVAYATTPAGGAAWWYRYLPKLRGTYHFRSRVVSAYGRTPALSKPITVVVK